jgi:orotidine-5'-phosphate decarboxylase
MEARWRSQRRCASLEPVLVSRRKPSQIRPNRMAKTAATFLSKKTIPVCDRLIVALDVPTVEQAKHLVQDLGDSVTFYKLGLQIFMTGGYFELADWLVKQGKHVFADLKVFEIPETVSNVMQQLRKWRVSFVSVHGGNDEALKAAVKEKNGVKVLAVTVLTSLNEADMKDLGFKSRIEDVVTSRAKRALQLNCDGVISSGLEAPALRSKFGDRFIVVTPGIRPGLNREEDDQKRTVDVEEAFLKGADYIVIGRPILKASDPKAAAEGIQSRIAKLFASES